MRLQEALPPIALLAVLGASAESGVADVLTAVPAQDATIYADNTANANGAGDEIFAGNNGNGFARRSLLRFDLSGVPTGAIVQSVTLSLYVTQASSLGSAATVASVYRLANSWGEGTTNPTAPGQGTPAQTGDVTWLFRFYPDASRRWSTAGGDFGSQASATASVGQIGTRPSFTGPGLTSDVQSWVNAPSSNFGWLLRGDETVLRTARGYASREAVADVRPTLTITYQPPPPRQVPTLPAPWIQGLLVALIVALAARAGRHGRTRS